MTVTLTPETLTESYSSALLAAATMWVMEAASSTASASWAARTVTLCAAFQFRRVDERHPAEGVE